MANPKIITLVADTDTTCTLDVNYAEVRVTVISNPAVVQFNTAGTAIASSTLTDGNEVLPAVLCSRVVADKTSGAASVVHLRSTGTPTLCIGGL